MNHLLIKYFFYWIFDLYTQLFKQAWLICLMAFVIGWSGMSNALSSTSHITAIENKMQTDHQAKTSKLELHCMQMDHVEAEAAHMSAHSSQSQHLNCHVQEVAVAQASLTQHCPDCSVSLCQSLTAWHVVEPIELPPAVAVERSNHLAIAYQAQHLAGFWQEILRPPKA